MKILFTSTGKNWESLIDPRFGRTDFFVIYDEEKKELSVTDNTEVKNVAHGAGTATAQKVFEIKPDVIITGNGPGQNAANALKASNIKIYINAHNMSLKEAYEKYLNKQLQEF